MIIQPRRSAGHFSKRALRFSSHKPIDFRTGLLALLLLLTSCAGKQLATEVLPAPAPQPPAASMPMMPAPSSLEREASAFTQRLFVHGEYYTGLLPNQRVDNVDGKQLTQDYIASFEPNFVPGSGAQFSGLSFAGYDLRPGVDYSEEKLLHLDWFRSPLNPGEDFWIGLADFSRDSWIWQNGPLPGETLDLSACWEKILSPQGYIYIEILFTGSDAPSLGSLRLGPTKVDLRLAADPAFAEGTLDTVLTTYAYSDGSPIIAYDYDFDGDGVYEVQGGSYQVEHTYSEIGTHHPIVRVRTEDSLWLLTTCEVTVVDPFNIGPTAILQAVPDSGTAPQTVLFDASASEDNDEGLITSCEWDLDGDGLYELNTGQVLQTTATFCNYGANPVKVRVTDNDKEFAVATHNVNLDSGWRYAPVPGTTSTFQSIDMELIGPEDAKRPGFVYRAQDGELYFVAAQTNLALEWSSPMVLAPGLAGKTNPALANVGGRPCIAFSVGSLPLDDAYFTRPFDDYGGLWGGAVLAMDGAGSWLDLAEVSGHPAIVSVVNNAKHLHYARALDAQGESWPAPLLVSPLNGVAAQSNPVLEVLPGQNPRIYFGRRSWFNEYGTFVVNALDPLGAAFGERVQVSNAYAGRIDLARTGNRSRLLLTDYWDISGLHYVCEDSDNSGWLPSLELEPNVYSGRDLGMVIYEGLPLVLYTTELQGRNGLRARQAADSLGSDWGPEMVLDPEYGAGSKLSMITSVGRPMLIYADGPGNQLMFASFY